MNILVPCSSLCNDTRCHNMLSENAQLERKKSNQGSRRLDSIGILNSLINFDEISPRKLLADVH